jgi:hypothetical protein
MRGAKMFTARIAPSVTSLILSVSAVYADCPSNRITAAVEGELLSQCLAEIPRLQNDIIALREQVADLTVKYQRLLNNTSGITRSGNTTRITADTWIYSFGENGIFVVAGKPGNCFASNNSNFRLSPGCPGN